MADRYALSYDDRQTLKMMGCTDEEMDLIANGEMTICFGWDVCLPSPPVPPLVC